MPDSCQTYARFMAELWQNYVVCQILSEVHHNECQMYDARTTSELRPTTPPTRLTLMPLLLLPTTSPSRLSYLKVLFTLWHASSVELLSLLLQLLLLLVLLPLLLPLLCCKRSENDCSLFLLPNTRAGIFSEQSMFCCANPLSGRDEGFSVLGHWLTSCAWLDIDHGC